MTEMEDNLVVEKYVKSGNSLSWFFVLVCNVTDKWRRPTVENSSK